MSLKLDKPLHEPASLCKPSIAGLNWPGTMTTSFLTIKRFQRSSSLLLGLVLSLAALSGMAADGNDSLKVYAELEERANFQIAGEDPVPLGPGHKVVQAVLAEAGFTADVEVVPWTRLVHSLESQQNVLGVAMTRTPQREDRFHWIGLIRPVDFKLWALPERADEFPDTLEDFRDFRVSAVRDDVVEMYLLDNGFTNLVYLSQTSNTLTMLRRNRVDLMPYIAPAIDDYLARKNEPPGTLVPVFDLEEISTGHFIVMSKQSDPALVKLLQDSYQAVAERGEVARILESHPE